jgi:hypothetical protein
MRKRFLESPQFTDWVRAHPPEWDAHYADFQDQLMLQPDLGKVMKGCGGVRKVRMADPMRGKGKRGGARVVYLHIPEADWIYLLYVYDKGKRDDLTTKQRQEFAQIAEAVRAEALRTIGRSSTKEES